MDQNEIWALYTLSVPSPFKGYVGQLGFYPFLFELFSGVYLNLSGPLASVQNLIGLPKGGHVDQNKIWTFNTLSETSSFKGYMGQLGFYPILFKLFSGVYLDLSGFLASVQHLIGPP